MQKLKRNLWLYHELMKIIFKVLIDPDKRANYDRFGISGVDNSSHGGGGVHDPFSVFREFFSGQDPFASMFGGGRGSPFGGFDHHDEFFAPFGGSAFSNFSASPGGFSSFSSFGFGGPGMTSQSTSIRVVNGVQVKTTETTKDGVTTVVKEENGRVVEKIVNGVQMDLALENKT
eukprot:TRINITY_DN2040_c0_g1_i1.p1 TRINITY_DN2040_c0_g1~~TRINITY_DN2040_c0_g1_i1.p1  ORF type:complete len:174 (-),score=46.39 TRINITY_DN2040_c0_g1_i1:51-572(-)